MISNLRVPVFTFHQLGRSSVHVVRETYFFHSLYIRGSCKIVAHSNHNLTRKSPLDFVIHSSTNMFLSLIVAAVLVPIFTASPVIDSQAKPQVLRYEMDTAGMPNSYNFYYDTSDGSSRTERGAILNLGTKDAALDVLGTVRWYDNKGQLYEMSYKAGKRGYRTIIKKVHEE
ncbi:flexible cuticle protein 12-like isoform X2 [Choristoneura fumiferana]|uniref:flexible cuticle protein 12-like isoform X2 n=1 Tax=Choristoneura fumiferana TaxID=7141 RepID=UPI003D15C37C